MVTRLVVRWALPDLATNLERSEFKYAFNPQDLEGYGYVWHCHIVDHEDNEMMRPTYVIRKDVLRTHIQGLVY